ncbi:MAG: PAS domain S-box protein [Desulfatibacillaceae bacterium]
MGNQTETSRLREQVSQLEAELREKDERLAEMSVADSVLRCLNAALFVHDGNSFSWGNSALAGILGYASANELIGRSVLEHVHPDDRKSLSDTVAECLENRSSRSMDYRGVTRDGTRLWMETVLNSLEWNGRAMVGGTLADISRRKQAEQEMRGHTTRLKQQRDQSEEKFHKAFMSSPESMAIVNLEDNTLVEVNQALAEAVGFTREEMIGRTALALELWADSGQREKVVDAVRREGRVRNVEVEGRSREGETRVAVFSAERLDLDGTPHMLVTLKGLTELRQAQRELSESEKRYYELVRRAPGAIMELDLEEERLVSANRIVWIFLGYTRREITSMPLAEILTEDGYRLFRHCREALLSGKPISPCECEVKKKDGTTMWVMGHASPPEDVEKNPVVRVVALDVTEKRKAVQALERMVDLEKVLNEVSTRFVNLPHDRIDEGIVFALERISRFARAQRGCIYTFVHGAQHLLAAHSWQEADPPGRMPDLSTLPTEAYVWLTRAMEGDRAILVDDARNLREDDAPQRMLCEKLGARGLMAIPLAQFGGPSGLLLLDSADHGGAWGADAVHLVECAAEMFVNAMERKRHQATIERRDTELEIKSRQIEEVNYALRRLLDQSKEQARKVEQRLVANVKDLVVPYVHRLQETELTVDQRVYLNVVQSNLEELMAPFMRRIASLHSDLTPREIEVANLVRMGASSREISRLLGISKRAVEFHRDSLRKKLGLKNRKMNLRAYLASIT